MPCLVNLWKHPKTGFLHFHEIVPEELRKAAGQTTYRRSLKVRKSAEAAGPYAIEEAKYQRWLDSLRNGPSKLNSREIEGYVGDWYARAEAFISEEPEALRRWLPLFGMLDDSSKSRGSGSEQTPWLLEPPPATPWAKLLIIRPGPWEKAAHNAIEDITQRHTLRIDADTRQRLGAAVHRRLSDLHETVLRRWKHDFGDDPVLAQFPSLPSVKPTVPARAQQGTAVAPAFTFTVMFDRWNANATRVARTVKDYRRKLKGFAAFVGHDDPSCVSTDDVIRWRDAVKKGEGTPRKTATVQRQYVAALSAPFELAVKQGNLPSNPVSGAWYAGKVFRDSVKRVPYPLPVARAILRAARGESLPERRWLPWLLFYSGLRFTEAVQSLGADVREDGGIWYFSMNTEQSFKRAKAKPGEESNAPREIPLHPALVAEGFLDYARSLQPGDFLFPRLAPHADSRDNTGRASTQWRAWMRTFTDNAAIAPAHSARHLFEDLLREAAHSDELRNRLMGHETGGAGAGYGLGFILRQGLAVIQRIPPIEL